MAYHGLRGSLQYTVKFAALGALFSGLDAALDIARGRRWEWWHGIVAGTGTALVFSALNRFSLAMTRHAVLMSAGVGGMYSAIQWSEFKFIQNRPLTYETKYARLIE
jgi:hypothetical protein